MITLQLYAFFVHSVCSTSHVTTMHTVACNKCELMPSVIFFYNFEASKNIIAWNWFSQAPSTHQKTLHGGIYVQISKLQIKLRNSRKTFVFTFRTLETNWHSQYLRPVYKATEKSIANRKRETGYGNKLECLVDWNDMRCMQREHQGSNDSFIFSFAVFDDVIKLMLLWFLWLIAVRWNGFGQQFFRTVRRNSIELSSNWGSRTSTRARKDCEASH